MSQTSWGPQAIEPVTPVIIPMRSAADTAPQRRFAFPELGEPPAESPAGGEGPRVAWPDAARPETARAYAEVAQAIRWRLSADHPAAVAITSPGAGDGKTSLVIGLAPELARRTAGGVLVVDADFHGSGFSGRCRMSFPSRPGRLDELGNSSYNALIWPTSVPGLNVLPNPPRPQSRGVGPHWEPAWIAQLRDRWPLVLLECASLEHAETTSLVRHCEGVYVVVRFGHTARRAVVEAGRVVRAAGGRLLGCVAVG
jgi:Mrp family chromosome partitioning ATPase